MLVEVLFVAFTFVILSIIPTVYAQSDKTVSIVSDASKLGDKAYDPSPITISQGDTVVWTNNDFGIHTVTENNDLFSSKDLRPDQTFEYTFGESGNFDYHCKLHPTMTGKVIAN